MKEKRCGRCNKVKDTSKFYKSRRSKSGFTKLCISCSNLNFSEKEIKFKTKELECKEGEKVCRKCYEIKPLKLFRGKLKSLDGKGSTCKKCGAQYSKENRSRIYNNRRSDERKRYLKIIDSLKPNETYCTKCDTIKQKSSFQKSMLRKEGKTGTCGECNLEWRRKYTEINREKLKKKSKKYRAKNREKRREYNKKYGQEHKEQQLKRSRKYRRIKYSEDPIYKAKVLMRNSLYYYCKKQGFKKDANTSKVIGCSYKNLLKHLDNNPYGFVFGDENVDIDHIIPLSSAETKENIYKLSHYTNLQLLPSEYNQHIKQDNPFDRDHFEKWLATEYSDK